MNYVLHIIIMIGIYSILALSLNLLVGYTGLVALNHAAFYGLGAYISTLLAMKTGLGFVSSLLVAILINVVLSFVISIPSLRLKGDYFILATLGFQIIIFTILYNWVSLTRGPYGIAGIPLPEILGLTINTTPLFFLLTFVIAFICGLFFYLLGNSAFGRALKSIREDEIAATSLGKNVIKFKIIAYAIASCFAAISGVLYARYMRYIDPTSFTLGESIFILSILIIGGTGNLSGPIIGTILMIILPEILRLFSIPNAIAANLRQIIYGFLIIIILRYMPQGINGEFKFE